MQRGKWTCVVCKSSPNDYDIYLSSTVTSSSLHLSLIRPQFHQNDKQIQHTIFQSKGVLKILTFELIHNFDCHLVEEIELTTS